MTPEGGGDRAPMFSRAEIEGGLPARRASGVLFAIEALTARLVVNQRITRAAFVGERTSTEWEQAFLQAIAAGRDLPVQSTIQHIERFAPQWADLVPDGAEARAALVVLMAAKYRLARDRVPRIRATLGLSEGESIPIPTEVELQDATGGRRPTIHSDGELLGLELSPGATRLAITLSGTVGPRGSEA